MSSVKKGGKIVLFALVAFWSGLISLFGDGTEALVVIAVLVVFGRALEILSTSYCAKVAALVVAGFVVFDGAKNGALVAAVVGASLWHWWGESDDIRNAITVRRKTRRRQRIFFDAIFSLLGYIAKADGAVRGRDINFATVLMAKMQLNEESRARARESFRRGKDADFDIEKTLRLVREECADSIGMFMRILSHAAVVDGNIGEVQKRILHYVGGRLGLSKSEVEQIEAAARGGKSESESQSQSRSYGGYDNRRIPGAFGAGELGESYKILGVADNASNMAVKQSYRRLMSRHHPDKLAAKGMPPEMMRVATERTQDISRAYERIKKARGM